MASTRSTRRHLAAILDETRVMERLIDDLRTVALSEAGTLTLHREPTDPDVLIAEVVRSFEGAAGTAGVTVTAEVGEDLPILDVDPVRLREVLANLVANAIRHTPAGGTVAIRGEVTGDRLVLRVADSGSGIDPDVLPHVFDRFVKGAGSGGSGLGLAIARHLVAAHGGTLEVEATGSAGTTFRASLPLTRRGTLGRRSRDPDVVHGRLDGRGRSPVLRQEHDPHLLPGPRRHRDRGERPCRPVRVRGAALLADQRARPVRGLDVRAEHVRRRSNSRRGPGSTGTPGCPRSRAA